MNALIVLLFGIAAIAVGYFVYARWINRTVIKPDPKKATPAKMYMDGVDFTPANRNVLFGYQFKSIAALGPIVGPIVAVQWGWLPALLWSIQSCCLAWPVVILLTSLGLGAVILTRFGTRLEASMDKAIRRGRILREILKQEQLHPLPVEFHMAWLIAFNAGLFDHAAAEHLPEILQHVQQQLALSSLCLEDDREKWLAAVHRWLAEKGETGEYEPVSPR